MNLPTSIIRCLLLFHEHCLMCGMVSNRFIAVFCMVCLIWETCLTALIKNRQESLVKFWGNTIPMEIHRFITQWSGWHSRGLCAIR